MTRLDDHSLLPKLTAGCVGVGVFVLDHRDHILHADDQALRMAGVPWAPGGPELPSVLMASLQQAARVGRGELPVEGRPPLALESSTLPGDLKVLKVLDPSAEEELDHRLAQRERLANLGSVAAGMGHEVATPLAYASLALKRLEEARLDEDLAQDVSDLAEALRRIHGVVQQLRSFSRPGQTGAVCTRRAVQTTLGLLRTRLTPLAVELHLLEDCRVRANEGQLVQVLVNLLSNAADVLDGRPDPRITVRVVRGLRSAQIRVEDNGPGVPEHMMESIFDPFVTGRSAGTGLGLALSRYLVDLQRGCLSLANEAGGGAVFTVELPLAEAGLQRLLLVDDEPLMRRALCRCREFKAYDCVQAGSVDEAIAVLESQQVDAVVTDLHMPGRSGLELLGWLDEHQPALLARTVLMSGAPGDAGRADLVARIAGAVCKPSGAAEVLDLLKAAESRDRRSRSRRDGADLRVVVDGVRLRVLDAGPESLRLEVREGLGPDVTVSLCVGSVEVPMQLERVRRGPGEAVYRVVGPCRARAALAAWCAGEVLDDGLFARLVPGGDPVAAKGC